MFGSHLSVAGGLHNALLAAERLGFSTVQVFTANPRSFGRTASESPAGTGSGGPKGRKPPERPPVESEVAAQWTSHRDRLKFAQTVSHDSYLINLASPDEALWLKSIDLFVAELCRCVALGIPYLVTHPGAHTGSGEKAGLKRVAAALDRVHTAVPAAPGGAVTCLEITAGQGTCLGHRLEHLAEIIAMVQAPERLGVCLDTAHVFAAGYDFRGRRYATFRKEVDRTVGVERIKVLHLNDSKRELGSRVDRHEHIGQGRIGLDGFKPWVRDAAFADLPKILETEKGKAPDGREWDAVNFETLRSLL